jgi:cbb3-type cytochrome oxidase subunit 3
MADDFDRRIADLLETAEPSPPLPPGWQARALAALARVAPGRADGRRWVLNVATGLLVALALGFLPYSTSGPVAPAGAPDHVAAALAAESDRAQPTQTSPGLALGEQPAEERQLAPYRRRAVAFVRSRYPNDPDMLLAAGMMTDDSKAGLALLKKAVEMSDSPAAWPAYIWRLRESGPAYERVAGYTPDPSNPEQMAEARKWLAESKLPEKLSPGEAAPILAAIRGWEKREPDNALPVAVEMHYLYGLHEDAQARECWRRAGTLPKVDGHQRDLLRVAGLLLTRMGMRPFDAISVAYAAAPVIWQYSAFLRQCARIAQYEGRLAHMQGRGNDAIAWWNGTISFGQHMMDSADSIISYLVGIAIKGIGASPTWRWFPDRDPETGIARGPLLGGRILYGEQHAFYISQVGEAADAKVRDQLVLSKVRSMMLREAGERDLYGGDPRIRFLKPLGAAILAAMLLAALLVVFAAFGTWRRRQADGAASLPFAGKLAITVLVLAPLAVAAVVYEPAQAAPGSGSRRLLGAGLGTAFALAILLPLVAALMGRPPGARLRTAWRGNLRRTLPLLVAACAVVSLSLGITAKVMQVSWTRQWLREPPNEMARVVAQLGSAWTHPAIPPDSWRAEKPPPPQEGAPQGVPGTGRGRGGGRGQNGGRR